MKMLATIAPQMNMSWHEGGLFMGTHWVWWAFWILLGAVLITAMWRVGAERREARRNAAQAEQAEQALRQRFAKGELEEDEYAKLLNALRGRLP